VAQELAGPPAGLEEGQLQLRPVGGQHQAGKASATAEIQRPPALRQAGQQRPPVGDLPAHRAGAEKAEILGPGQDLVEIGLAQEELARALMTTRRRGSSPSETVATPSISFTMSWTILRSTGDIGSNTWSRPDSMAR